MPTDIHRELADFEPEIVALLEAGEFWDLEGEYDPTEFYSSIPIKAKKEYVQSSKEKNSRIWDIVKALVIGGAIATGISQFKREYKQPLVRQVAKEQVQYKGVIPAKPTAKDYMNQYIKERGGEFIQNMGRTDQKKLVNFIWSNAGEHERPLKKMINKQPHLRYVLDQGKHREETIIRTEKGRATRYGAWQFAGDNGAKTKTRQEAGDARTRPSHRAQMGITVLINEPYPDGEMYPGEMSINCRGNNRYDFDTKTLTQNPKKVYEDNLESITEDAKAVRKAERDASNARPVEIQKGAPIGGEVIPRKVAPKVEPRKVAKLTEEEKYSVEHYASDGFLDINKYLRGHNGYKAREDDIKRNIARLDSAIGKSTVPKCTVYRGFESSKIYDNLDNLKGAVIDDKAFVSTSLKKDIGNFYATGSKNMVIEIYVPDGAKALDLKGLATNKAESEILLPRNSKFKVLESSKLPNGQGYIKAELIK